MSLDTKGKLSKDEFVRLGLQAWRTISRADGPVTFEALYSRAAVVFGSDLHEADLVLALDLLHRGGHTSMVLAKSGGARPSWAARPRGQRATGVSVPTLAVVLDDLHRIVLCNALAVQLRLFFWRSRQ